MEHDPEPVADDELLYRRVPASTGWYDPTSGMLKSEAFAPHKVNDATGLSVSRGKYKLLEEAALGRPGKTYYIAVINAGELRQAGIDVVPQPHLPSGYDPSHAELPGLNSSNRKATETLERQRVLVSLCRTIEGPYETPSE